ncbi:uncharacterized protein METZ01_LOCUS342683, partial [marine metagenome]
MNDIRNADPNIKIHLCATTHRAALVLKEISGEPVTTGHKLFKLRPVANKKGKEEIKHVGTCEAKTGSVVIIDESSMIGNEFLKAIVEVVKKKKLKLIFVGDPFQLPPVSDKCSIFDGSLLTYTLTTVHRQLGGNPILEKANEFREYIEG